MATSIGDEINAATRSYHTTLNQLILQLLPLSLPPHTANSHLYAQGISHFHPIYSAFESSLRTHISSDTQPSRTKELLQSLHVRALERAAALENDINLLLPPSHRIPNPTTHPRLEAFKQHIQLSLAHNPHLFIAYTWIFYMALFSGGRYIRSKLRTGFTPPSKTTTQQQLDQQAGLSFWAFPGDSDGEDLKLDYKARVIALSDSLTEEQKADIVAEAIHIMISLTDIVREVAETVPEDAATLPSHSNVADDVTQMSGPIARTRPPWILLLRNIFPMGIMDLLSTAMVSRSAEHRAGMSIAMQVAAE